MRLSVRIAKRAIDIAGSLAGMALAAPVAPVIMGAIYMDSPGPIFYRQRRAGRLRSVRVEDGGRRVFEFETFYMTKFRTMRTDAEKFTGAVLAQKNDPRITRVGRVLRKTRLDELPQLWDCLRGAMSIVGPRPERPELLQDLAAAIPLFEERMRGVKPGITGLAQISLGYTGEIPADSEIGQLAETLQNPFDLEEARGAIADDMRIKMLYDMAYSASLERFSTFLRTELGVIVKTPMVMLRGVGQ